MSGAVMVVDDDDDIREIISSILIMRGFSVVTACDGTEALAQLQSGELPALILLDLMMPNMSGEEFRSRQMADARLARVPVVVLSGAGEMEEVGRRLQVEAISKPIELADLVAVVKRYCGVGE